MEGGIRVVHGEKKIRKKKKQSCPIFFTVFRWPEFDSSRIKVGLLDESYE